MSDRWEMVLPIQEISAVHKKGRQKAPFPFGLKPAGLLQAKSRETFVESRDLTAAVYDAVLAGPCWMAGRINLQLQRVAGGAPGGAGLEFGTVGHHDRDFVIIRMDISLHCMYPSARQALATLGAEV